jgi:hypothetical protein
MQRSGFTGLILGCPNTTMPELTEKMEAGPYATLGKYMDLPLDAICVVGKEGRYIIALYNEKSGELSFPYHADEHTRLPAPQTLHSGTLCARVIRNGQNTKGQAAIVAALSRSGSIQRSERHPGSWRWRSLAEKGGAAAVERCVRAGDTCIALWR